MYVNYQQPIVNVLDFFFAMFSAKRKPKNYNLCKRYAGLVGMLAYTAQIQFQIMSSFSITCLQTVLAEQTLICVNNSSWLQL